MDRIKILVLDNDKFSELLEHDLVYQGIPHVIHNEIKDDFYDVCVYSPNPNHISQIQKLEHNRSLVFNGIKMTNPVLKKLVKMRIEGFIDDHEDTSSTLKAVTDIYQQKTIHERIAQKIDKLHALA